MKKDTHPQYYPEAKVKCICGNEWITGSTLPEISTSICSKCHPFYSGQEKILDTRGRVDKFKKRLEKTAQKLTAQKSAIKKTPKKRAKSKA